MDEVFGQGTLWQRVWQKRSPQNNAVFSDSMTTSLYTRTGLGNHSSSAAEMDARYKTRHDPRGNGNQRRSGGILELGAIRNSDHKQGNLRRRLALVGGSQGAFESWKVVRFGGKGGIPAQEILSDAKRGVARLYGFVTSWHNQIKVRSEFSRRGLLPHQTERSFAKSQQTPATWCSTRSLARRRRRWRTRWDGVIGIELGEHS